MNMSLYHHSSLELPAVSPLVKAPPLVFCKILVRTFKRRNVQLITTDGFLYPNKVLEEQGIMDRKGFPESYDMEKLINFLNEVKSGKDEIKAPVYSHSVYDVIEGEYELIQQPDILIVEGINTTVTRQSTNLCE